MRPGAAIVDLSIDQGGIAETSAPTTHARPTFIRNGVVHYCVTNMPAMVPHTSTYALTNATLTYALEIADRGILEAGRANAAIRHGLNTYDGHVVHPAVAQALQDESPLAVGLALRRSNRSRWGRCVVALLSGLVLAVGAGLETLDVLRQVEIAVKIGDRLLHAFLRDFVGAHPSPGASARNWRGRRYSATTPAASWRTSRSKRPARS